MNFFLTSDQYYGDFTVYNAWVYSPDGLKKNIKDMVYTPMGGSLTIIIMVYAHFGGSTKLNQNTRW